MYSYSEVAKFESVYIFFLCVPYFLLKLKKINFFASVFCAVVSYYAFFVFFAPSVESLMPSQELFGIPLQSAKVSPIVGKDSFVFVDGHVEILALHLAYPERLSKPSLKDGFIGFYLDDLWFYWADGRIVPSLDSSYSNFSSHLFFDYQDALPQILVANEENALLLREEVDKRYGSIPRSSAFLDALYKGSDEKAIDNQIKVVRVFGFKVRAHSILADSLASVSTEIIALSKTDKEVSAFIRSLKTVSGFVWRNVSKSANRSYHSYGAAFDTLPIRTGRKQVYWAWSRVHNKHWYSIPHENRWLPPDSVVEIFERHGFVWGGKWRFFDTIHFEYRPEILIYNKIINDKKLLNELLSMYAL